MDTIKLAAIVILSACLTCTAAQDNAGKTVPIPILSVDQFGGKYEPTCLSNGFIGFRPGTNPLVPAPVTVAGFYRTSPLFGCESLCPVPYPFAVEIKMDGQAANLRTTKQSLDLSCGELTTEMEASTATGKRAAVKVVQFASRSVPCVVAQEIVIQPSQDLHIELTTHIDINGSPVEVYRKEAYYQSQMWDHVLGVRSDRCKLGIAVVAGGEGALRISPGSFTSDGKSGKTLRFQVMAALVPEYYSADPEQQACRMVQRAVMIGYDDLRAENLGLWKKIWRSRIRIIGDMEAQKALDVAFYYLHSEAHPSSKLSIPCFGLSLFENYQGDIFWDADAWMFLPVVLSDPEAGRKMVGFRRNTLDAAEKIASLYGCQGAQYPWQSSPRSGSEGCPHAAHTGWSEQHVNHHVAIAQWQYCLVTGDEVYMREGAWPVLKGVADWICSRGVWTSNGFEIQDICGVDEDSPNISNGSHMNLTGRMALEAAIACGRKLGYPEPKEWRLAADKMFVPMDASGRVIIPYPGAKHTPGRVGYSVGMLPFLLVHNPPVPFATFRATWEFEEKVRMEQPASPGNPASSGSPGFTAPPMAAAAALFGNRKLAREIFHNAWKPYWREPFGITSEYQHNEYGNYLTNYGSLLQNTLLGFTGLRISDGDWRVYPASLPDGWEKIECDLIWVKGKPMKMFAEQGKLVTLIPLDK
jgi:protein-glucosylgalactosylhydroxylysine glucosidase